MKLSTQDENYFRAFAQLAHEKQARLEDYYIEIQRSDRDERGSVTTLRAAELHGLSLACDHIQRDETCLILGCGCGVEASWLVANGITNITGLDISESVLATCEKLTGIKTVCGDMRRTGLSDKSYDVVLTHRSLHHLFYPFQALEEFSRIAKKKVLILNEPVRSALKVAVRSLTKRPIISGANIYEYQFVPEDVHRYMAFNGFRLAETIRYKVQVRIGFSIAFPVASGTAFPPFMNVLDRDLTWVFCTSRKETGRQMNGSDCLCRR